MHKVNPNPLTCNSICKNKIKIDKRGLKAEGLKEGKMPMEKEVRMLKCYLNKCSEKNEKR